jgi:hypothetical protein
MAETLIPKSANASVDASTGMLAPQVSHLILGEDVTAMTPLQLKADGKLWKASGAAADSNARIIGFASRTAKAGQTCTPLGLGLVGKYADGTLVPGSVVYLGTNGTLSSTASVGDTVGIAQAVDTYNIRVTRAI